MHRKKELCRNFQRGSCQYGERCKFLHQTQQHPKPNVYGFSGQASSNFQHTNSQQQKSNPFGFGAQASSNFQHTNSQQQRSNTFGFGVQSNSLPKGVTDFGSKQNHVKPFENKWSRFSPLTNGSSSSPRQSDNQVQTANHKCTDPESCKHQIVEDFELERPNWKLTCYAHCKSAPCDIAGDISYEELRLAAYDDARRGLSLQSIVERERSLLNSKLIEFDNLLHKPYTAPRNSARVVQSPVSNPSASALTTQNNTSSASFSQLSTSHNMGFGTSPPAPSNNGFVQQSNSFPFASSSSGASFGINNLPFGNAGSFGSQLPVQNNGNPFANTAGFSSNNTSSGSQAFSPPTMSPQIISLANNKSSILSNGSNSKVGTESTMHGQLDKMLANNTSGNSSIWLKEEWIPGEIPEEEPPAAFV